jgi:hypothetical protein
MLNQLNVNHHELPYHWRAHVPEFRKLCARECEKLEKRSLSPFSDRPRSLLFRHSFSNSEVLGLLSHVIVVNVEHDMLPPFSLSGNAWSCGANTALNCTLTTRAPSGA